mmetsp:Transcript_18326/g.61776  ORF Transcript_18326/g.61776 Transcript_18326/m.61776 type:complete len:327 (-) Transcript_18326:989-1969(-)
MPTSASETSKASRQGARRSGASPLACLCKSSASAVSGASAARNARTSFHLAKVEGLQVDMSTASATESIRAVSEAPAVAYAHASSDKPSASIDASRPLPWTFKLLNATFSTASLATASKIRGDGAPRAAYDHATFKSWSSVKSCIFDRTQISAHSKSSTPSNPAFAYAQRKLDSCAASIFGSLRLDSDSTAAKRGGSETPAFEKAHTMADKSRDFNVVILETASVETASKSAGDFIPCVAKTKVTSVRLRASKIRIFRTHSTETASNKAGAKWPPFAKAQAVLVRFCELNASTCFMATRAKASNIRGAGKPAFAKAQAVVARSCGL